MVLLIEIEDFWEGERVWRDDDEFRRFLELVNCGVEMLILEEFIWRCRLKFYK